MFKCAAGRADRGVGQVGVGQRTWLCRASSWVAAEAPAGMPASSASTTVGGARSSTGPLQKARTRLSWRQEHPCADNPGRKNLEVKRVWWTICCPNAGREKLRSVRIHDGDIN